MTVASRLSTSEAINGRPSFLSQMWPTTVFRKSRTPRLSELLSQIAAGLKNLLGKDVLVAVVNPPPFRQSDDEVR